MKENSKVREKPRLSAAKMGEYTAASPRRRERIIRDAKFPAPFITASYAEATAAIRRCFVAGGDVTASLQSEAIRILSLPNTSAHEQSSRVNSARAVRALSHRVTELPLKNVVAEPFVESEVKLRIEGVTVSVFPQVILSRARPDGSREFGALLVVMRKTEPLAEKSGQAVAELIRRLLVKMGREETGSIDPKLCLVLDVFHNGGKFQAASRGGKRIADDLESACREIAARWPEMRQG